MHWTQPCLDDALVPAEKEAAVRRSLRGSSTELTLVTEGAGLPMELPPDSAQKTETRLTPATLETMKGHTLTGREQSLPMCSEPFHLAGPSISRHD